MSHRVKTGTFNRKCAVVSKSAVYIIKKGSRRVDAYLYDLAWKTVRAKRKHAPLEDELLWHKVYEEYIGSLPKAGGELIERHLRIVPAIAGRIAWKRCPGSFGVWAKEAQPSLSHVGLVYELTALGNLALFIAADRYDPKSGRAFSTYANYWIKKFIRLYLEELIGVVPRTGDMGIEEQGVWECGPWVVDKPRRSVMDLLDAALAQQRLFRGKAAGGMATFDGSITIPGPKPGDKEIETVGTDGQTNPERLDYLQRRVGKKDFPWADMGTLYSEPLRPNVTPARFEQVMETRRCFGIRQEPRMLSLHLPGHAGGRASDGPPREHEYKPSAFDDIALPPKPVPIEHTGPYLKQIIIPAEICYLDKRCGRYDSRENFGEVPEVRAKELPRRSTPHFTNALVFAVEYQQRKLKLGLPPAPRRILSLRPPRAFEWPTPKTWKTDARLTWCKPSSDWLQWPNLIKFKYRARSSWRVRLKPNDWRLKWAKERQALLMPEVPYSHPSEEDAALTAALTETANEWTDELCITA